MAIENDNGDTDAAEESGAGYGNHGQADADSGPANDPDATTDPEVPESGAGYGNHGDGSNAAGGDGQSGVSGGMADSDRG